MLMGPAYYQNQCNYGHSVLIFLTLVQIWLHEIGQILGFWLFSEKHLEGMAWNLVYWNT